MKCIRCGYCCIKYVVVIVDNPDLGIIESNLIVKDSGVRCKHLIGEKAGEYSCAIHDREWYKETPCFAFGQVETSVGTVCRMGEFFLKNVDNIIRC